MSHGFVPEGIVCNVYEGVIFVPLHREFFFCEMSLRNSNIVPHFISTYNLVCSSVYVVDLLYMVLRVIFCSFAYPCKTFS
jgi:hypothetical protein